MMECVVCTGITNKYKCTKCLEAYCSLECYKQHQQSPKCMEKLKENTEHEDAKEDSNDNEPTVHEPFKTEDTVPRDKLHELTTSLLQCICTPKNYISSPKIHKAVTALFILFTGDAKDKFHTIYFLVHKC